MHRFYRTLLIGLFALAPPVALPVVAAARDTEPAPSPAPSPNSSPDAAPASPHPVVAQLIEEGLALEGDAVVKVTAPLVTPQMAAAEQEQALKNLLGTSLYARYLADRIVAPQKIIVKTEQKLGRQGAIRRLDQYFVVYGDLAMIQEEGLMNDFMAKEKKAQEDEEPQPFEEYMQRRLSEGESEEVADGEAYLYRFRMPLLDKVMISGLIRGQSYSQDDLLVESAVSSPDLLADADDPTVWQAIPRGAKNDQALGAPKPWRGLAGYMQVTPLKFMPGALLVECHGVLVEPTGWFGGRTLLASKLPAVTEQNVRKLRRKLKQLQEEKAKRDASG